MGEYTNGNNLAPLQIHKWILKLFSFQKCQKRLGEKGDMINWVGRKCSTCLHSYFQSQFNNVTKNIRIEMDRLPNTQSYVVENESQMYDSNAFLYEYQIHNVYLRIHIECVHTHYELPVKMYYSVWCYVCFVFVK